MKVTIVCGPPGAGKSTYVRERKKSVDIALDVDELYQALTMNPGSREKPEGVLPFVLAARDGVIDLIARGFLSCGDVWIIMCGENNETRSELRARLNAEVVILDVPAGECIRRMRDQGRPAAHIRDIEPVVLKWHRKFRAATGETYHTAGRQVGLDGWPAG